MNLIKGIGKYIFIIPFILFVLIAILPLCNPGLIVGGDWTSPYTNKQLKIYAESSMSIWSNREIPTGTLVSHQNAYLNNMLAGIWANAGLSGESFQKTTLFVTLIGIYYFSYLLFFRLTKNKFASSIASLSYALSPLVFNYVNMGWNFVLLFLALAPLYILISIDYFKIGGYRRLLTLGLICAVGFMQSQVIVWFPIIFFLVFINRIEKTNIGNQVYKFFIGVLVMAITTITIHAPWIISGLNYMNDTIKPTSNIDLDRFSIVFTIYKSFLGWGSLFNQQFEFAFPIVIIIFAFFPMMLIIYSAIINKKKEINKLFYLVLSLLLIAPLIYIFRIEIAQIPFSTIIRDSSRFLVITSIGLSLGIALSISIIKSRTIIAFVLLGIVLSIYPSISGKMYTISNKSGNRYSGQDFRLRLLNIPMESYDQKLSSLSGQTNLLYPIGGTLQTKTNILFTEDFWGIPDIQSFFSPYVTGIYKSDKSNPLVSNFVNALQRSENDIQQTKKILGIYGVNNIINRSNLLAFIKIPVNQKMIMNQCDMVDNIDSDWSITEICQINNTYPIIYSSISPIYSTKLIEKNLNLIQADERLSIIGCPESVSMSGIACGPLIPYKFNIGVSPDIKFSFLNTTNSIIDIKNINGPFILVLNKTYHPGWRIIDSNGKVMDFDHILINQLVNGWYVNLPSDIKSVKYTIEFYPQTLYSKILPYSTISFLLLTFYVFTGFRKKK